MPTYYLYTQPLCRTVFPAMWDEVTKERNSNVYICQTCGDAWGRVVIPDAEWYAINRGCSRHPDWSGEAGTFIHPWRKTYEDLPPEVLRYEFLLRANNLFKDTP